MKMKVRRLKPADAEKYLAIRQAALKESPTAFAASYEEEKNQTAEKYRERFALAEDAFTFGLFEDTQLIGVVTLIRESFIKLRHRANIVAMYIHPEKRGRGLANALMSKAIKQANRLEGVEQIYLSVVSTNTAAKRLYTSCGFKVFGKDRRALKVENIYYDEEHMVYML